MGNYFLDGEKIYCTKTFFVADPGILDGPSLLRNLEPLSVYPSD